MRLPDSVISTLWRAAARIGPDGRRRFSKLWGQTAGRLRLRGQVNWRRNVELATGTKPSAALVRAASASWLRNMLESISLERWTPTQINAAVLIDADHLERLRASFDGPGAVLALGHLGSWDLCGAWACLHGMPVSSVAEHLNDVRFEHFLAAREALGMRIHALSDDRALDKLVADVGERRLVCLLADRDLSGRGVRVRWPDTDLHISVPVGPALLAQRTGADLLVVRSHYEGDQMRILIGEPVDVADGTEGLATTMQVVVDQLAEGVRFAPTDWHMYPRFFKGAV